MKLTKETRSEIITIGTIVAGISLFMMVLLHQMDHTERALYWAGAMIVSLGIAMYFAFQRECDKECHK